MIINIVFNIIPVMLIIYITSYLCVFHSEFNLEIK